MVVKDPGQPPNSYLTPTLVKVLQEGRAQNKSHAVLFASFWDTPVEIGSHRNLDTDARRTDCT